MWFAVRVNMDRDAHSVVYSMETSSAVCLPSPWDGAQRPHACSGLMELQSLSSTPRPWPLGVHMDSGEVKECLQSIT